MKSGDIVIFEGKIGKVVLDYNDRKIFRFHPVGYGRYYTQDLSIITDETAEPASHEEKIKYIKRDFNWGEIIDVHVVGDYQIIAYIKEKEISYHPYINFDDTNHSYSTLEKALIGVIAYRWDGANSQAAGYFCKMIGL